MSDTTVDISDALARGEIFDRHAYDNKKALDSINTFLTSHDKATLSMDEFRKWMVTGKEPARLE